MSICVDFVENVHSWHDFGHEQGLLIEESRKAIEQSERVKRLTLLATLFL